MISTMSMDVEETVLDQGAGRSHIFCVNNRPCQVPVILATICNKQIALHFFVMFAYQENIDCSKFIFGEPF